jgi:hypothetical protein
MFHLDKKGVKRSKSYYCEYCDYTASQKSNWERHLKTKKHQGQCFTFVSKTSKKGVKSIFKCDFCEKVCKSRTTLWRHKKTCSLAKINNVVESKPQTIVQNITNNINYNCFNVFLDEHCKNAQTLKDFVNSINVSLKDLDYTKKNGYVEGISSILNKQLEDLNPTDRPIHSTDPKRLKFMVKNKDGWVKDDGSQLNKVVIRETKFKLVKSLSDWEKENPGYGSNPQKLQVWQESLNKIAPPEDVKEKYDKAIIKNIAKEASIKDAIKSLTD